MADVHDVTVEILRDIRDGIGGLRQEMHTGFRDLGARIDETNARIDGTNARIDETNARIDETNARIDVTNTRLGVTNARLDDTIARLDETNARLDGTNERIDNLIGVTGGRWRDHEERLTRIERHLALPAT